MTAFDPIGGIRITYPSTLEPFFQTEPAKKKPLVIAQATSSGTSTGSSGTTTIETLSDRNLRQRTRVTCSASDFETTSFDSSPGDCADTLLLATGRLPDLLESIEYAINYRNFSYSDHNVPILHDIAKNPQKYLGSTPSANRLGYTFLATFLSSKGALARYYREVAIPFLVGENHFSKINSSQTYATRLSHVENALKQLKIAKNNLIASFLRAEYDYDHKRARSVRNMVLRAIPLVYSGLANAYFTKANILLNSRDFDPIKVNALLAEADKLSNAAFDFAANNGLPKDVTNTILIQVYNDCIVGKNLDRCGNNEPSHHYSLVENMPLYEWAVRPFWSSLLHIKYEHRNANFAGALNLFTGNSIKLTPDLAVNLSELDAMEHLIGNTAHPLSAFILVLERDFEEASLHFEQGARKYDRKELKDARRKIGEALNMLSQELLRKISAPNTPEGKAELYQYTRLKIAFNVLLQKVELALAEDASGEIDTVSKNAAALNINLPKKMGPDVDARTEIAFIQADVAAQKFYISISKGQPDKERKDIKDACRKLEKVIRISNNAAQIRFRANLKLAKLLQAATNYYTLTDLKNIPELKNIVKNNIPETLVSIRDNLLQPIDNMIEAMPLLKLELRGAQMENTALSYFLATDKEVREESLNKFFGVYAKRTKDFAPRQDLWLYKILGSITGLINEKDIRDHFNKYLGLNLNAFDPKQHPEKLKEYEKQALEAIKERLIGNEEKKIKGLIPETRVKVEEGKLFSESKLTSDLTKINREVRLQLENTNLSLASIAFDQKKVEGAKALLTEARQSAEKILKEKDYACASTQADAYHLLIKIDQTRLGQLDFSTNNKVEVRDFYVFSGSRTIFSDKELIDFQKKVLQKIRKKSFKINFNYIKKPATKNEKAVIEEITKDFTGLDRMGEELFSEIGKYGFYQTLADTNFNLAYLNFDAGNITEYRSRYTEAFEWLNKILSAETNGTTLASARLSLAGFINAVSGNHEEFGYLAKAMEKLSSSKVYFYDEKKIFVENELLMLARQLAGQVHKEKWFNGKAGIQANHAFNSLNLRLMGLWSKLTFHRQLKLEDLPSNLYPNPEKREFTHDPSPGEAKRAQAALIKILEKNMDYLTAAEKPKAREILDKLKSRSIKALQEFYDVFLNLETLKTSIKTTINAGRGDLSRKASLLFQESRIFESSRKERLRDSQKLMEDAVADLEKLKLEKFKPQSPLLEFQHQRMLADVYKILGSVVQDLEGFERGALPRSHLLEFKNKKDRIWGALVAGKYIDETGKLRPEFLKKKDKFIGEFNPSQITLSYEEKKRLLTILLQAQNIRVCQNADKLFEKAEKMVVKVRGATKTSRTVLSAQSEIILADLKYSRAGQYLLPSKELEVLEEVEKDYTALLNKNIEFKVGTNKIKKIPVLTGQIHQNVRKSREDTIWRIGLLHRQIKGRHSNEYKASLDKAKTHYESLQKLGLTDLFASSEFNLLFMQFIRLGDDITIDLKEFIPKLRQRRDKLLLIHNQLADVIAENTFFGREFLSAHLFLANVHTQLEMMEYVLSGKTKDSKEFMINVEKAYKKFNRLSRNEVPELVLERDLNILGYKLATCGDGKTDREAEEALKEIVDKIQESQEGEISLIENPNHSGRTLLVLKRFGMEANIRIGLFATDIDRWGDKKRVIPQIAALAKKIKEQEAGTTKKSLLKEIRALLESKTVPVQKGNADYYFLQALEYGLDLLYSRRKDLKAQGRFWLAQLLSAIALDQVARLDLSQHFAEQAFVDKELEGENLLRGKIVILKVLSAKTGLAQNSLNPARNLFVSPFQGFKALSYAQELYQALNVSGLPKEWRKLKAEILSEIAALYDWHTQYRTASLEHYDEIKALLQDFKVLESFYYKIISRASVGRGDILRTDLLHRQNLAEAEKAYFAAFDPLLNPLKEKKMEVNVPKKLDEILAEAGKKKNLFLKNFDLSENPYYINFFAQDIRAGKTESQLTILTRIFLGLASLYGEYTGEKGKDLDRARVCLALAQHTLVEIKTPLTEHDQLDRQIKELQSRLGSIQLPQLGTTYNYAENKTPIPPPLHDFRLKFEYPFNLNWGPINDIRPGLELIFSNRITKPVFTLGAQSGSSKYGIFTYGTGVGLPDGSLQADVAYNLRSIFGISASYQNTPIKNEDLRTHGFYGACSFRPYPFLHELAPHVPGFRHADQAILNKILDGVNIGTSYNVFHQRTTNYGRSSLSQSTTLDRYQGTLFMDAGWNSWMFQNHINLSVNYKHPLLAQILSGPTNSSERLGERSVIKFSPRIWQFGMIVNPHCDWKIGDTNVLPQFSLGGSFQQMRHPIHKDESNINFWTLMGQVQFFIY